MNNTVFEASHNIFFHCVDFLPVKCDACLKIFWLVCVLRTVLIVLIFSYVPFLCFVNYKQLLLFFITLRTLCF